MLLLNTLPDYRKPLDRADADLLGVAAAQGVERYLSLREAKYGTPLLSLPELAAELGVGSVLVKDEGQRLGLGSFKALGGAYAVCRLVVEEAAKRLGRTIDIDEFSSPDVRRVAETMTFACATDGNHGRSVAQGAQLVGAKSAIFVHAGVTERRIAAIARYGAEMIRVNGNYDDSVDEAARVAAERGWTLVSDTSWPGYERIAGIVMQGYTAIASEVLREMAAPPTHVFVQCGVGGIAAAIAGHLAVVCGAARPTFVVVDPARSACAYESARAGKRIKVPVGEPTVMAMLECYEPSLLAWRILERCADAFMTVEDDQAIAVMNRLARPRGTDPAIVSGESGGVGLAGLVQASSSSDTRRALKLDKSSRVLLVNTEGATDPARYEELVGMKPELVGVDGSGARL